jgi:hypothetical protein
VARCTVERLMCELGLEACAVASPGGPPRPMWPPPHPPIWWSGTSRRPGRTSCGRRPDLCGDLVRLCLCGLGHRRVQSLPRRLAGLAVVADRPGPGRAGDGHLGPPRRPRGLVHHSDRGSQYLAIRYTERLAEAGAVTSVGSAATPTTTRWPRRSSAGSWNRSATSHRPSSRPPTTKGRTPAALPDSSTPTSGEPGAVQTAGDPRRCQARLSVLGVGTGRLRWSSSRCSQGPWAVCPVRFRPRGRPNWFTVEETPSAPPSTTTST